MRSPRITPGLIRFSYPRFGDYIFLLHGPPIFSANRKNACAIFPGFAAHVFAPSTTLFASHHLLGQNFPAIPVALYLCVGKLSNRSLSPVHRIAARPPFTPIPGFRPVSIFIKQIRPLNALQSGGANQKNRAFCRAAHLAKSPAVPNPTSTRFASIPSFRGCRRPPQRITAPENSPPQAIPLRSPLPTSAAACTSPCGRLRAFCRTPPTPTPTAFRHSGDPSPPANFICQSDANSLHRDGSITCGTSLPPKPTTASHKATNIRSRTSFAP